MQQVVRAHRDEPQPDALTCAGLALALVEGVSTSQPADVRSHANTSQEDAHVRALLLSYLDDHPTAMDTLDGIAEWWLLRQQIEIEVRRVSLALGALVNDGVLEEFEQSGVRFFRRRTNDCANTATPRASR